MRPIYWLFIIAAVLLLAVGIYLLTRRPSTPSDDDDEVSEYGPGGRHVAAGDAGVEPASPAPQTLETERSQDGPFDQEADQDDRAQTASEDGQDASSVPEAGYIDTATGQEVPLDNDPSDDEEEGEPTTSRDESATPEEGHLDELQTADQAQERADREAKERAEHEQQERDAAATVTYGSPSDLGEDKVYAVPDPANHDADNDASGAEYAPGEVGSDSPAPESGHGGGSTAYRPAEQNGQRAPGPERQPVERDETARPDETDETYETARPAEPAEPAEPLAPTAPAWEEHDDDVPPDAATAGFETAPSPYGPGTALPAQDGSGPEDWDIKGNAGSMLFHTPDSPSYAESRAEVWFESEQSARAAGFAHWDRKRR